MNRLFLFMIMPTLVHAAAESKLAIEHTRPLITSSSTSPLHKAARNLGIKIGDRFNLLMSSTPESCPLISQFNPFFKHMPTFLNLRLIGSTEKSTNYLRREYYQMAMFTTRQHLFFIMHNKEAAQKLRQINDFFTKDLAASLEDLTPGARSVATLYDRDCPVTAALRKFDRDFQNEEGLLYYFKDEYERKRSTSIVPHAKIDTPKKGTAIPVKKAS